MPSLDTEYLKLLFEFNIKDKKGEIMKMKKMLISVICNLIVLNAYSEESKIEQIRTKLIENKISTIIPEIGFNYSTITGSQESYSYKGGSNVGVLTEIKTSTPDLNILTGLEYIESGFSKGFGDLGFGLSLVTLETKLKYLSIPTKAKYHYYHSTNGSDYYLIGELSVDYLMSAESELTGFTSNSNITDISSNFNKFDLVSSIGLGYNYQAYGSTFSAELEYNRGLLDISKDSAGKKQGFLAKFGYVLTL